MNRVRLRQNAFDRWIVIEATNESMAWSGSRFVSITEAGLPASDVQVSRVILHTYPQICTGVQAELIDGANA